VEGSSGNGNGGARPATRLAATVRLVALAAVVGAIGGLLGVAFRATVDQLTAWLTSSTARGPTVETVEWFRALPWWRRLVTPAAGALVGGVLLRVAMRSDTAFGLTDLMEVVTFRRREIRIVPTLGRIASALATLCSGGSVGREGPAIQLGATAAHVVGRASRADPRSQSILIGAGAAAGVAAAYNAPFAGALFVMEVVLASFAMDVFAPVAVAVAASTLVMRTLIGDRPLYQLASDAGLGLDHAKSFGMVAAALPLGLACGAIAVEFQRLLQRATSFFGTLKLSPVAKAALGGLVVGAIGIAWPEVFGNGFDAVTEVLHHHAPFFDATGAMTSTVLVLLFMKPVATASSIGSGGQGGVFTPSLFVGAALGALLGAIASHVAKLIPGVDPSLDLSTVFAVVAMGGVIAGVTHAPVMAVALLVEMTQRSQFVLPLAVCAAAAALTAKRIAKDSLYTARLRARGVPVDAGIEELALRQTHVGDLLDRDAPTVVGSTPLAEIVERFARDRLDLLYVVDEQRRLHGVVALHDVKDFFNRNEGTAGRAVIALDVVRRAPTLDATNSLAEVLEPFDLPEFDELPVVARDGTLLGRVTRRDVLATLNLEVLGRPSARARLVVEGDELPHHLELPSGFELARLPVTHELAGRRLGDTGLRRNHKLVVLAIVKTDPELGEQRLAFDPDAILDEGSQLVVMGRREDVAAVRRHGAS
jgi:CIC family chloride channel protein